MANPEVLSAMANETIMQGYAVQFVCVVLCSLTYALTVDASIHGSRDSLGEP